MAALARRGYGWGEVKRCMERCAELTEDEEFED